jgi:cysteinyl-tRNA synthetase
LSVSLRIHNTLSRQKEVVEPIETGHVRMYVCGPTVYDYAHIGNARPIVVFDVLARLLRHLYASVTYVRNITDIDDKINAASRESGESIGDITARTTAAFHADVAALGAEPPDVEPRATEHVDDMISMIKTLIDAGHAYAAYGGLSRRDRDEQIAGARVEVAPYKKDPADFVLWKPSDNDTPGWDSPWGFGRPGWHIECSAMSNRYLGTAFDIHGGGQDLIFPHHENEIAQSLCAFPGEEFARVWMHNGYLMAEGEKMSKSLGNFYTVHDLLEEFPGESIRLTLLTTHYRQPQDFTKAGIGEARQTLDRFYGAMRGIEGGAANNPPAAIVDALADDMNTPLAMAAMHELVAALNKCDDVAERARLKGELLAAGRLLGLLQQDPEDWFRWQPGGAGSALDDAAIEALIKERAEARAAKDFARADAIRDELAENGVVLEDSAGATTWKRG